MLTTFGLLGTAFGMSVASALLPVISVELFVLGVVANGSAAPWWALALVIAIGQIGGKTVHYCAARGVVRVPARLRRVSTHHGRFGARLARFREACQHRPVWAGGTLLVSATVSLPPFAPIAAMAGWARIPWALFLITGFFGRLVRFGTLTAAPSAMYALVG